MPRRPMFCPSAHSTQRPAERRQAPRTWTLHHGTIITTIRHLGRLVLALALQCPAWSQAEELPLEVAAALRKARLPETALAAMVQEAGNGTTALKWNAHQRVNPASVFKLLTTQAALDLLGPAWSWSTPVFATGPIRDGVLEGSVAIRGSGDPTLVVERAWLLLRRLQQLGVREIRGDIVLDHGAFNLPEVSAAEFDGDASRPYNVRPDALLLNYKAYTLRFSPDATRGLAVVGMEPALAGVAVDLSVPLSGEACGDWRSALKANVADAGRVRFGGRYPLSCGEKEWPVAYAEPRSHAARMLTQMWAEMGGRLQGSVRDGNTPAGAMPLFQFPSPPLAEVVRSINKFSNNLMAEQLFLSLALERKGVASVTQADARETLNRWLIDRLGEDMARDVVIDNGSGLSRDARVTPEVLMRLLQQAWSSPVMAELMSSLPISGQDGTMKRSSALPGRAHLKTGSLRDVTAVAGYVLSNTGRRYVLVAMLNHPQAAAGRPVLDALVQWTLRDAPAR